MRLWPGFSCHVSGEPVSFPRSASLNVEVLESRVFSIVFYTELLDLCTWWKIQQAPGTFSLHCQG